MCIRDRFLSGQLQLAQSTAPVAIPRVAVKTDINGNYVWIVQDNKALRKRVKLAPSADETNPLVPVAEGVTAGSTILTLRGAEPNDGQAVAMPGAAAASAATNVAPGPAAVTAGAAAAGASK